MQILIKKRRAVGVQFDYDGKTYVVNAKREVILSAGTVNTAQLLMLSGIGPRNELARFKVIEASIKYYPPAVKKKKKVRFYDIKHLLKFGNNFWPRFSRL